MASKHLLSCDELYQYLLSTIPLETDIQKKLRLKTIEKVEPHHMMTTPEQAQFLKFMTQLINAKIAIEIGIFTGYGSLAIAEALPKEGQLIACDTRPEWVEIAKPFWEAANVFEKIQVYIQEAVSTLQHLIKEKKENSIDLIFIDADKANYPTYFELAFKLLRSGGLMIFDNMLKTKDFVYLKNSKINEILYDFNQKLLNDHRITITMIPLGGGMLLVYKK